MSKKYIELAILIKRGRIKPMNFKRTESKKAKEMTAPERLKEWHDSLDADTRVFVALVTKAYDEVLNSIENNTYDEETQEMLRLYAAEYYGMPENSGLVVLFSTFADGFLAGLESLGNTPNTTRRGSKSIIHCSLSKINNFFEGELSQ